MDQPKGPNVPLPLTSITNTHQYCLQPHDHPQERASDLLWPADELPAAPITTLWLHQGTKVRNSRADILEGYEQVSHEKSVFDDSRHRILKCPFSKTKYSTFVSYVYIPPRLTRSDNEHLAGFLVCSGYGFQPFESAHFVLGITGGNISTRTF